MHPPIHGSTILITGASSGIGRDLARQLASRAGALILVARRRERLEQLKEELLAAHPALKVHIVPCDLRDRSSVEHCFTVIEAAVGHVDVLINNAGVGERGLFDGGDPVRMEEIVEVNVAAVVRFTRRYVPGMVARKRGGIMNIGSGAGLTPMPGAATYVGSKYFISGFSQNLRIELAGTGVGVTHVCPGPVDTEFNRTAGFERFSSAGWIGISSEQCAREALRGFERGRYLVLPGIRYRLFMLGQALIPMFIKRWILQRYSMKLRRTGPSSIQ